MTTDFSREGAPRPEAEVAYFCLRSHRVLFSPFQRHCRFSAKKTPFLSHAKCEDAVFGMADLGLQRQKTLGLSENTVEVPQPICD